MPLTAKGVGHVYRRGEPGETRALEDVSLTIGQGEFVLVAGANGSGKTTLLQCLSGLLRPTSGRVEIDGANAVKARGTAALSIQFPERALFAPTVYEDVAFGPANMGNKKEEARERALEAIRRVGLSEELLTSNPWALSHGQRRLAALAGAIAVGPRYLFLDEPTAGLDPMGKRHVVRTLTELNKDGMAIIVASHDLGHLLGTCGRIVVLHNERIAIDGRPDELVSNDGAGSMGLALPPSVRAARWLRLRGFHAPWDVSPEALIELLRRMEREGARLD